MARLLVISYYFPPIGGAGAQRPARFVQHLHQLGHESLVITGAGETVGRWTPLDATLTTEVPPSIEVRRATNEPVISRGRTRSERWLGSKSVWSSWWVDQCLELGGDAGDVDVIYAFMSPYGSAEAGSALSSLLGKPWIADLGDPWALDEMMIYPTALHRRRELAQMRSLLSTASAIVLTTGEAVRRVKVAFPELAAKPVVSIPCGFDRRDFDGPPPSRDDSAFRIVHTGYLHTELGRRQRSQATARKILGGEVAGVDILTRSHIHLLEAVDRLQRRDPETYARVEAHFAGVLSPGDRELAGRSAAARLLGYVPHQQAIALMRSADLLFLPMQNLPPGMRSGTVPGKTYEYLASKKPILAAVPEGDARDILLASGMAHVCAPDDVEGLATAIALEIRGSQLEPTPGFVERFEYANLTADLATLIEEIAGDREQPPGRSENGDRLRSSFSSAAPPITSPRPRSRPRAGRRRRALLLAYYFPPIGGAGAQRSLKQARYLPDFGYDITVITGMGAAQGRWSPVDESLVDELPDSVDVRRIERPEPPQSSGWNARVERWARLESRWAKWWEENVVEIGSSLDHDVDVIVASMSPYNTAKAAIRLSEELGRPWVAGLRDPWALDEMMIYPTAFHRRAEMRLMGRTLRSASATVTTTPESARRVHESFPELAAGLVASIPNGFDASDFDLPLEPGNDSTFTILHSGYLHTDIGTNWRRRRLRRVLGGAVAGADILTRSHLYLLRAIEVVLERDPSLQGHVELQLAGVLSESDRAAAAAPFVRMHGYLPHSEAVRLMRTADLLFLPMQNLPPGVRSGTVPGKTYEYLASQSPILGAVPEGDARDLLIEARTAHVCAPDDVPAMAETLEREIARWRSGAQPVRNEPAFLQRFERRNLAGDLAAVLDAATGNGAVETERELARIPA